MTGIRLLAPADQSALEDFLAQHAPFTMMLRANLRASGVVDGTGPYHGAYAARFVNGAITDVAGHFWTNTIIFFAPHAPTDLARFLVAHTRRPIAGFIGPWRDCVAALDAFGLRGQTLDDVPREEDLFALDLARLNIPPALADKTLKYRRAEHRDLDMLAGWRVNYELETLRYDLTDEVRARARDTMARLIDAGDLWVALDDGVPVAMSALNAKLPDMVQVGGVHTPQNVRGKGYARIAVAGSLLDARAEGASTGILFTEVRNAPAKKVYTGLGFQRIGDYGLILLKP